ncbi:hypothetical protein WR25_06140 [Diploscapter pachys]|uniref:Uncharacterized protein n=1 Tax=Diploscapter pachys TaxID=2018661 RepID=A0A2A2JAI0_9BILA|nr:hypothetical protein WR25_06140 [Diploscapter pachys]
MRNGSGPVPGGECFGTTVSESSEDASNTANCTNPAALIGADFWKDEDLARNDYLPCGGYTIANGINHPPPPSNMLTPPHDNSPRSMI